MDEATREAFERIHDEDKRQNRRLDELERVTKTLQEITSSVQELALNMKHMAEEQAKQGQKLDQLEKSTIGQFKGSRGNGTVYDCRNCCRSTGNRIDSANSGKHLRRSYGKSVCKKYGTADKKEKAAAGRSG